MPEHLAHTTVHAHPATRQRAELPADALEAVCFSATGLSDSSAKDVRSMRDANMRMLRRVARDLAGVNRAIEPHVVASVKAMPQRVDIAMVHVLAMAVGSPDIEVALGFCTGLRTRG